MIFYSQRLWIDTGIVMNNLMISSLKIFSKYFYPRVIPYLSKELYTRSLIKVSSCFKGSSIVDSVLIFSQA